MNLKEYDNNIFTKEKNEVEKYLLRIIQRYFDIENNYTKESIEAIIIEALTRLKREIISEKGFAFSLNQKTGHIVLTVRDLGGETAFSKNSAFNKDFGTEADTICEGNDERLYDEREPLAHTHIIGHVNDLIEKLAESGVPENMHIHYNKSMLDMITYTGTRTEIDLIVLEYLEKRINESYENLLAHQRELKSFHTADMEELNYFIPLITQELQSAKDIIDTTVNWLQDSYDYTDNQVTIFETSILKELLPFINKTQLQNLTNNFKNPFSIVSDGEIQLTDGTLSCFPVQEYSSTGMGDNYNNFIREFYNTGTAINSDHNDSWDTAVRSNDSSSFNELYLCNKNATRNSEYGMLINADKFDSYTLRVSLTGGGSTAQMNNRIISVVIAYDETTGNNLSILCSTGANHPEGIAGTTVAGIVLNYAPSSGSNRMDGDLLIDYKTLANSDDTVPWELLDTGGITILIKRNRNNIKIWTLYNEHFEWHDWNPTTQNGIEDIYLTESPTFEFNLEDYPELESFVNNKHSYGYGYYLQPAIYENIYFINNVVYEEPYGHTNLKESNQITYAVPGFTTDSRVKMFFRYDKDGQTIDTPLPFNNIDEMNNTTTIQGAYTKNGNIVINTDLTSVLKLYVTDNNFYDQNTIIGYNNIDKNNVYYNNQWLSNTGCTLCKIDSEAKNNFVAQLLQPDTEYLIDGKRSYITGLYYDSNSEEMTYFNWDNDNPVLGDTTVHITISSDGKWESTTSAIINSFIAEYKVKKLTEYYENPRIYYQVLENKEVI